MDLLRRINYGKTWIYFKGGGRMNLKFHITQQDMIVDGRTHSIYDLKATSVHSRISYREHILSAITKKEAKELRELLMVVIEGNGD